MFRELGRHQDVVGIEEAHVGAARGGEPRVARGGQTSIRLTDDPEPPAVSGEHGLRVVGRAVVDHHDLDALERLGNGAVERLAEKPGVVVGGDHQTHAHRMTS